MSVDGGHGGDVCRLVVVFECCFFRSRILLMSDNVEKLEGEIKLWTPAPFDRLLCCVQDALQGCSSRSCYHDICTLT